MILEYPNFDIMIEKHWSSIEKSENILEFVWNIFWQVNRSYALVFLCGWLVVWKEIRDVWEGRAKRRAYLHDGAICTHTELPKFRSCFGAVGVIARV